MKKYKAHHPDFACRVCGSIGGKTLFRLDKRTIITCDACGTGESLADSDAAGGHDQGRYFNDEWVADRTLLRFFLISQAMQRYAYLRRGKKRGAILEIGFGTGEFLEAAVEYGNKVSGVDISPLTAEYVRKSFPSLDIRCGRLEDAGFEIGAFDVIAAFHVVEHIEDLDEFFRQIRNLLAPGGILFVVVPNIDSLYASLTGKKWLGFIPAHVRQFSAKGLRECFERNGFEVAELSTHEPKHSFLPVVPFYFLREFIRRDGGIRSVRAGHPPGRYRIKRFLIVASMWYRHVASMLLWPFIRVLELMGKGDELYILGIRERDE